MLAELSEEEEEDLLGEEMSDVEMEEEQLEEEKDQQEMVEEINKEPDDLPDKEDDQEADEARADDGHEEVDEEVSFKKDSTLDNTNDNLEDNEMEVLESEKTTEEAMEHEDGAEELKEDKTDQWNDLCAFFRGRNKDKWGVFLWREGVTNLADFGNEST